MSDPNPEFWGGVIALASALIVAVAIAAGPHIKRVRTPSAGRRPWAVGVAAGVALWLPTATAVVALEALAERKDAPGSLAPLAYGLLAEVMLLTYLALVPDRADESVLPVGETD